MCASQDGQLVRLFHDTRLALGESNVPTRLVRDELDFNLPALASWLIIVVVVVVGGRRALALDATTIAASKSAIAHGMVIERWRALVVFSDVGHGDDKV